jgi:hypothetical protein
MLPSLPPGPDSERKFKVPKDRTKKPAMEALGVYWREAGFEKEGLPVTTGDVSL